MMTMHAVSLVLALVDELLECFLQSIAELLILLESLIQDSVKLQLHLQESRHHILILQQTASILAPKIEDLA